VAGLAVAVAAAEEDAAEDTRPGNCHRYFECGRAGHTGIAVIREKRLFTTSVMKLDRGFDSYCRTLAWRRLQPKGATE
jgi:hypothetical protein